MTDELKIFCWKQFACGDYYGLAVAVAVATSEEEAKRFVVRGMQQSKLLKKTKSSYTEDFWIGRLEWGKAEINPIGNFGMGVEGGF